MFKVFPLGARVGAKEAPIIDEFGRRASVEVFERNNEPTKKHKRQNRRDEKLDSHSFRGVFREVFWGTSGEHF